MNTNFQGEQGMFCVGCTDLVNQRGPIIYQAATQIQIKIQDLILMPLCQLKAGIVLIISEAFSLIYSNGEKQAGVSGFLPEATQN